MKKYVKGVCRMQATVLSFKPIARVKKADKASQTQTPQRFNWITNSDMEEINEVDTRGRGYDYLDHCKEE